MRPVIFLDSGGVINDNEARAPQWRRRVAEYFAPRLGGEPSAWEEANRVTAERLFEPGALSERMRRAPDWVSYDRDYNLDWLRMMCEYVGVPVPQEDRALALAVEASRTIVGLVHAPMAGATEAILALHGGGFELHTASGEYSDDLDAILRKLGVRHCFGRLYGPDLVNSLKAGPEYYRRVFAGTGVQPGNALVVDDSPRALGWAQEMGAKTVLVQREPPPTRAAAHIGSLAELPRWLEGWS
jgi:HAD superfamily hydrolase (TIGR01509 family)